MDTSSQTFRTRFRCIYNSFEHELRFVRDGVQHAGPSFRHGAKIIYKQYIKRKELLNKKGIYLGTPRLGVSNNSFDTREQCNYDNLEFWQPNHKSFYNPSMTILKMSLMQASVSQLSALQTSSKKCKMSRKFLVLRQ